MVRKVVYTTIIVVVNIPVHYFEECENQRWVLRDARRLRRNPICERPLPIQAKCRQRFPEWYIPVVRLHGRRMPAIATLTFSPSRCVTGILVESCRHACSQTST